MCEEDPMSVTDKLFNAEMRRECADPGSMEICGCGVSLGRSDTRGNMCRQHAQSYQCTAARRATLHTHPRLRRERRQRTRRPSMLKLFRITV